MISQSDIIKTLVNNNCTDETVLSTALSKDCTPTKLLEKLTETERFDLALDISMKSGLDVIPLWRTWAMRCLKNRNFQGAREKFRHCFPRLKLPGYRVSPIQSGLLTEILKQLARMEETQLLLSEEIEIIKQRNYPIDPPKQELISRPTIFAECSYYMKQYGGIKDHIKFYVANNLWDNAAKDLIEYSKSIDIEKFFLSDVVQYTTSRGKFDQLIKALLILDPDLAKTSGYFKGLYQFCLNNRRYNLLNYIQESIGDHIAAADTQIRLFFFKKPVKNYRELSSRIVNLTKACHSYEQYLKQIDKGISERPTLFKSMTKHEVEEKIKLINLQIEITRNFSINEVSGCINGIDVPTSSISKSVDEEPNDLPVTLFDKSEKRKTFLAALVLIYFDLSCSSYFSKNGLEFAIQLISEYELSKIQVFKTAMRIIIEDESCDILANAELLLERIKEDYATSFIKQEEKQQLQQLQKIQPRDVLRNPKPKSASNSTVVVRRTSAQQSPVGAKNKNRLSTPTRPKIEKPNMFTESSQGNNPSDASELGSARPSSSSSSSMIMTSSPLSSSAVSTVIDDGARKICDEVLKDSIKSCREPDYKMELAKLLSGEAKIELYIELGKLSNAQRLAFDMNRPDYVSTIIERATKLNQGHVKTVCQLWLAKHETNKRSSIR